MEKLWVKLDFGFVEHISIVLPSYIFLSLQVYPDEHVSEVIPGLIIFRISSSMILIVASPRT